MTPHQKIRIMAKKQAIQCIHNIFEKEREAMPIEMMTGLYKDLQKHRAELVKLETEALNG